MRGYYNGQDGTWVITDWDPESIVLSEDNFYGTFYAVWRFYPDGTALPASVTSSDDTDSPDGIGENVDSGDGGDSATSEEATETQDYTTPTSSSDVSDYSAESTTSTSPQSYSDSEEATDNDDGYSPESDEIEEAYQQASEDGDINTGDKGQVILWIGIFLAAGIALAYVLKNSDFVFFVK